MRAWPLFYLRVITPQVILRVSTEPELNQLAIDASKGLLEPEQKLFLGAWAQVPSPEFEQAVMRHHYKQKYDWSIKEWSLSLGIYSTASLRALGMITMRTQEFLPTRSVNTGSWLLPDARGQGFGKEARAAVLHFAFECLDSAEARSIVHPDNKPSLGVCRSLGYKQDGTSIQAAGHDIAQEDLRMLLKREDYRPRDDISVVGFDKCRQMFGL